jgi:hypothetical protein
MLLFLGRMIVLGLQVSDFTVYLSPKFASLATNRLMLCSVIFFLFKNNRIGGHTCILYSS